MAVPPEWLSEQQWSAMRESQPLAVLATADTHGRPHTAVVSWLAVPDRQHIRLAVDTRGQHLHNLEHNPRLSLQVLGDGLLLTLGGSAEIGREPLHHAPFPASSVRIDIDSVVDQTPPHVRFRGPSYEFSPEKADRYTTEVRVLQELDHAHPNHSTPSRKQE